MAIANKRLESAIEHRLRALPENEPNEIEHAAALVARAVTTTYGDDAVRILSLAAQLSKESTA
jgi:hypothetical protein